jgi:hypothetical protein
VVFDLLAVSSLIAVSNLSDTIIQIWKKIWDGNDASVLKLRNRILIE